jgi:hypothetical protein
MFSPDFTKSSLCCHYLSLCFKYSLSIIRIYLKRIFLNVASAPKQLKIIKLRNEKKNMFVAKNMSDENQFSIEKRHQQKWDQISPN